MQPGAPGNWQPPVPTVTPTLQFATVGRRLVAYIIDGIILAVVNLIVNAVLSAIGLAPFTVTVKSLLTTSSGVEINYVGLLLYLAAGLAISAAYFIYTWTTMRATIGMRLLNVQIGNEGDGATLTQEQAAKRWAYLALPSVAASIFMGYPALSTLVALAVVVYYIALLYTTYQSPTKQGLHDKWAKTQVVASV